MPSLMDVPGLGGYLQAQQLGQQRDMGQLQQAQTLMGILSQVQQQQQRQAGMAREQAWRGRLAELGPNPTAEQLGALAAQFGDPKDVMQHADRQTAAASTREMAMARLQQQARETAQRLEVAQRNATTAEEQARISAARAELDGWYKRGAMNVMQGRAAYELPPQFLQPMPAAPMQGAATAAPAGGMPFNFGNGMQGTVPDEAAGAALWQRLGRPGTIESGAAPSPQPAAPVAAPIPASAPAPVPGPAPQPVPAPTPAPQPSAPPAMPQFTGSPREVAEQRNKWMREQAEAGRIPQRAVVNQVTKSLEENYTRLRDAPQALANIEKAKELIPSANMFQGSLGEQKLAVAKFFNNNLGTSINLTGVSTAEELRSRIFFNIMDNLKKMDAQPSQLQQQIMQDALGKLGTDPSALANILDAFGDVIRDKVGAYDKQVSEASGVGVNWPHRITVPARRGAAEAIREFATEAEAAAAGLAPGTRIRIGGKSGTWR